MASMTWVPALKRWRVRWRATNRKTHEVFSGSRTFTEKPDAAHCWADMEAREKLWRRGATGAASLPLSDTERPAVEDARLLTPEVVADLLGVPVHVLTQWRERHQGPRYWLMGS